MRAHFSIGSGSGTGVLTPPRPRSSPLRRDFGGDGGPEPPDDGDGGGGGGGDGDPGPPDDGPRDGDRASRNANAEFGLELGLISIASMFMVFLFTFIVMRKSPGPTAGGAPDELWLSTMLLGLSSVALVLTGRAARQSNLQRVLRGVVATLALGLAFLASQIGIWFQLEAPSRGGYVATFYALTGLHAIHILGGLVFLASVFARMLSAEPRGSGQAERLRLCGMYWHFMGAVWIVLFAALEFFV